MSTPDDAAARRPGRATPGRLGALAVVAAGVLVALTVVIGVGVHGQQRIDDSVTRAALAAVHAHALLLSLARAVTQLGNPTFVDVVVAAVAVVAAARHRWAAALAVVLARSVGLVLETALKAGIGRPRPAVADPVAHAAGASFPSGHSAGAATLATLAVLTVLAGGSLGSVAVVSSRGLSRGMRTVTIPLAALAACAVAASRVLLGVHYLTDVVAGTCLGFAVTVGSVVLVTWAVHRRRPRTDSPRRAAR